MKFFNSLPLISVLNSFKTKAVSFSVLMWWCIVLSSQTLSPESRDQSGHWGQYPQHEDLNITSPVLADGERAQEHVYPSFPGSILFKWMTTDPELQEKQEDILSILEEQFPNLPPRDDIISVLQETQLSAQGEWLS